MGAHPLPTTKRPPEASRELTDSHTLHQTKENTIPALAQSKVLLIDSKI